MTRMTSTAIANSPCPVLSIALLVILSTSGCASMPSAKNWGDAFLNSALDESVWVPAALGAVFVSTNADESVSDWAIDKTPIFRSQTGAEDATDFTLATLFIGSMVTTYEASKTEGPSRWTINLGGIATAGVVAQALKPAVGRERPNGQNDRSFPSAHSTNAFSTASVISHDLDVIPYFSTKTNSKLAIRAASQTLAALTAWGRVEAGLHFPSDVLFGAAIGNYFTAVFREAFRLSKGGGDVSARVVYLGDGVYFSFSRRF